MKVINTYVGRFAPSPTGPLHFGSLVAALASFLDARKHQGQWLVRIEDIDPPRESPTAPIEILNQLKVLGLKWDGEPLLQSTRLNAYQIDLDRLNDLHLTFQCNCSRRSFGAIYPGTCRESAPIIGSTATRVRVNQSLIEFLDLFQGQQKFDLQTEIGDFILKRKDGLIAYQLAVITDDDYQGITHVIRGYDLLDSTPRQIYLARCLGFPVPVYGHFPVILGNDGHKLSKQTKAAPVTLNEPILVLNQALLALGQSTVSTDDVQHLLRTATDQWRRDKVPATDGIPLQSLSL
jgi:glutamyl-Q tRNA(Asp) synthetase